MSKYDRAIGARVREYRLQKGVSQSELAHGLGLTFQQVQKYEKGINRISAGRLYEISEVLEAPLLGFFDGVKEAA